MPLGLAFPSEADRQMHMHARIRTHTQIHRDCLRFTRGQDGKMNKGVQDGDLYRKGGCQSQEKSLGYWNWGRTQQREMSGEEGDIGLRGTAQRRGRKPCSPGLPLSDPCPLSPQWDLVCSNRALRQLAQSLYMVGVLLGAMVFGYLADRSVLGRATGAG